MLPSGLRMGDLDSGNGELFERQEYEFLGRDLVRKKLNSGSAFFWICISKPRSEDHL